MRLQTFLKSEPLIENICYYADCESRSKRLCWSKLNFYAEILKAISFELYAFNVDLNLLEYKFASEAVHAL